MFSNYRKKFIGQISSETLAALIYDKHSIAANGLKVKTNFSYTKKELMKLFENDDDVRE